MKHDELRQGEELEDLKAILAKELGCEPAQAIEQLDTLIRTLFDVPTLSSLGMKEEEIVSFSQSVVKNQQRLMSNGYVNLNEEQIQEVYKRLF